MRTDAILDGASASSIGEWFTALRPSPPPALGRRLSELLAPYAELPPSQLPESCLAAGELLLNSLLASGSTTRGTALDLLAADALVTYAFQAAASEPHRIEARAIGAMTRIASLANLQSTQA